ncbi:hypothetical protein DXG01_010682 [Tephrocybe rancida]|nr:hypothetical protein DXG01_010682 [Tephrocybe rancida]
MEDFAFPLERADIQEISEADDERTSEGKRKLSWIWKTLGIVSNDSSDLLCDALQIEWCKSHARAVRFSEEVKLLTEEMARVLRYMSHQQQWWLDKAKPGTYGTKDELLPICKEGLTAYASRQAALCRDLRQSFSQLWLAG